MTEEEIIKKFIQPRIDYIKKYKLNSDYSQGFSGIESGPCCKKCKVDYHKPVGNMMALVGCRNPFQMKADYNIKTGKYNGKKLCQCHIPYRKVAIASELQLLKELKEEIERNT